MKASEDTVVKSSQLRDIDFPKAPRSQELIDQQYTVLEIIGQGTFGKVYKILDKRDKKHYALKIVVQEKRYKNRQMAIISTISHPNIVRLIDNFYTNTNNEVYLNIVMNLMPTSLFALLRSKRKKAACIEPTAIKLYAFQMLKALAYFEDISLGHRDLKPMNILIDPETHELHICDFGSAKVLKTSETNICYMCSRYYRAPELLFGQCDYFTEIDIWSVGCILAEMVTKEPIFTGENTLDQIIEIIKVVGTPDETFLARSPDFNDIKLPQLKGTSWKSILRKYKCCPKFLDLLSNMLIINPNKRIKPAQALAHEYFADIIEPDYIPLVSKIPHLFDFTSNQFLRYEQQKLEILNRFHTNESIYTQPLVVCDQKPNPQSICEKSTSR